MYVIGAGPARWGSGSQEEEEVHLYDEEIEREVRRLFGGIVEPSQQPAEASYLDDEEFQSVWDGSSESEYGKRLLKKLKDNNPAQVSVEVGHYGRGIQPKKWGELQFRAFGAYLGRNTHLLHLALQQMYDYTFDSDSQSDSIKRDHTQLDAGTD